MLILTGGAGFIGSCLLSALNKRGEKDILVVDHLGNGPKWKNLVGKAYRDYLDKAAFLELVSSGSLKAEVSAVIHMGACSSTTEADAGYLMSNNTQYTKTLAEWALNHKARFIYASSAATYGDGSQGYKDDEAALDRLKPLNMYGYSKHLFDQWAHEKGWFKKIVGLKFFNVYGPNEGHKGDMMSLVAKAYKQVKETGKIRLFKSYKKEYPDGGQVRDFVYVKDVVGMVLKVLDTPGAAGLYNMGSGRARTWNDLAKALFLGLGKPAAIEYTDMPEVLKDKYQYHTLADMGKFIKAFGPQAVTSMEDAVADYLKNHLSADAAF